MTKKVIHFLGKKIDTPVTAPGDTNLSDATSLLLKCTVNYKVCIRSFCCFLFLYASAAYYAPEALSSRIGRACLSV